MGDEATSGGDGPGESGAGRALRRVRFTGDVGVVVGGALAVIVSLGTRLLSGRIYSEAKAVQLIEGLRDASLYFGAAVATASATILALMLTLLGLALDADIDFQGWLYRLVRRIGGLSTLSLCGAILLLTLLSLPVGEFERLPQGWYEVLYWFLVLLVAALSGLVIAVVLLLFEGIRHVVATLAPDRRGRPPERRGSR